MPTPLSNLAALITPAQFLLYVDARAVGKLVADNDVAVPVSSLATNPVVLEYLLWATGELESHCVRGQRYLPADLLVIATSIPPTATAALLRGTIARWAHWGLMLRRYPRATLEEVPGAQQAHDTLLALADGVQVFGLVENIEASNAQTAVVTDRDLQVVNGVAWAARRYWGVRADRFRRGFP